MGFFHSNYDFKNIKQIKKDNIEDFFCINNDILNKLSNYGINCTNIKTKITNLYSIKKVNKQNKIIFLILATKKYIERFNSLLDYLEDSFNYEYFIILSGNENKINDNIIYVNVEDHWENLSKKLIIAYELIFNFKYFDFIYKVDDDFYDININLSDEIFKYDYYGNIILKNFKKNYQFNKCFDQDLNTLEYENDFIAPYAAGGYGYLLSRKSVNIILENKDYFKNEIYEDKAIGDILYLNNIESNKNNYENIKKNKPNKKLEYNCVVIFYHKNIKNLYKKEWIDKCIYSILDQTYKKFDILEINYGNENYSIFENYKTINHKHFFYKKNYKCHSEAMTFLLNKAFYELDYNIVFNTNLDDYYEKSRFYDQLKCINDGYILCSTNMNYVNENNEIIKKWEMKDFNINSNNKYIEDTELKKEINKNNNIITHPSVCFTKYFTGIVMINMIIY